MRVRWLNASLQAVRAIHSRVAADNPQAGSEVVKRIEAAALRLGASPAFGVRDKFRGRGRLRSRSLPALSSTGFNGDDIEVLRVFHASMNWPSLMQ